MENACWYGDSIECHCRHTLKQMASTDMQKCLDRCREGRMRREEGFVSNSGISNEAYLTDDISTIWAFYTLLGPINSILGILKLTT